jgi:hypothetical protein
MMMGLAAIGLHVPATEPPTTGVVAKTLRMKVTGKRTVRALMDATDTKVRHLSKVPTEGSLPAGFVGVAGKPLALF